MQTLANRKKGDLYYLIYTSYARIQGEDERNVLLKQARENNKRHDVTGMLLYLNSIFIQLIEGEFTAVQGLYSSIIRDTRHIHVVTLRAGHIQKRYFRDWSRAFKAVSTQEIEADEAYRAIGEAYPQNAEQALRVFELLSAEKQPGFSKAEGIPDPASRGNAYLNKKQSTHIA